MRLLILDPNTPFETKDTANIARLFTRALALRGHQCALYTASVQNPPEPKNPHIKIINRPFIKGRTAFSKKADSLLEKLSESFKIDGEIRKFQPDFILAFDSLSAMKAVQFAKKHHLYSAFYIVKQPNHPLNSALKSILSKIDLVIPSAPGISGFTPEINKKEIWTDPVFPGIPEDQIPFIPFDFRHGQTRKILLDANGAEEMMIKNIINAVMKISNPVELHMIANPGLETIAAAYENSSKLQLHKCSKPEEFQNLYQLCDMIIGAGEPRLFFRKYAESLFWGKPCLAPDHSLLRETYGDNLFYFSPESPRDLFEKILRLMNDPSLMEAQSKSARKNALTRFNLSSNTLKLEQILMQHLRFGVAPLKDLSLNSL